MSIAEPDCWLFDSFLQLDFWCNITFAHLTLSRNHSCLTNILQARFKYTYTLYCCTTGTWLQAVCMQPHSLSLLTNNCQAFIYCFWEPENEKNCSWGGSASSLHLQHTGNASEDLFILMWIINKFPPLCTLIRAGVAGVTGDLWGVVCWWCLAP